MVSMRPLLVAFSTESHDAALQAINIHAREQVRSVSYDSHWHAFTFAKVSLARNMLVIPHYLHESLFPLHNPMKRRVLSHSLLECQTLPVRTHF